MNTKKLLTREQFWTLVFDVKDWIIERGDDQVHTDFSRLIGHISAVDAPEIYAPAARMPR